MKALNNLKNFLNGIDKFGKKLKQITRKIIVEKIKIILFSDMGENSLKCMSRLVDGVGRVDATISKGAETSFNYIGNVRSEQYNVVPLLPSFDTFSGSLETREFIAISTVYIEANGLCSNPKRCY